MRRFTVGLFAVPACAGLVVHACASETPPGTYEPSPPVTFDAAPDVDAGSEAGQCRPSNPSQPYSTKSIASWESTIGTTKCRHPDVNASCDGGFCRIPAGCFIMGSPETEWARGASSENEVAVFLTRDFLIGEKEVTIGEWLARGFANPSGLRPIPEGTECRDDPACPVASVNLYEVAAFANALSTSEGLAPCFEMTECIGAAGTGMRCASLKLTAPTAYECKGYRIPTEAEWEYAARAGTRTSFYSGNITDQGPATSACCQDDALNQIGWYCANAGRTTHPVGQKPPNAWGLHDVLGNVMEFVIEAYAGSTEPGPLTDPWGFLSSRQASVARGGSFALWASLARASSGPLEAKWGDGFKGLGVGLRLARTVGAPDGGTR